MKPQMPALRHPLARLLLAAALFGPEAAMCACANVEIGGTDKLDFGLLRVAHGGRGWALLGANGVLSTSPGVSIASNRPASAGRFRFRAPPSSELTLMADFELLSPGRASQPATLGDLSLQAYNRPLERSGQFWTLATPASREAYVEGTITVGASMQVQAVLQQRDVRFNVRIECVDVRPSIR